MGVGKLLLPERAEIRKKSKKKAGDYVHVILYPDESVPEIPSEIIDCSQNGPKAVYETFLAFTDGVRKAYLDRIYRAKTENTKARRILRMMDRVQKKLRFYDQGEAH